MRVKVEMGHPNSSEAVSLEFTPDSEGERAICSALARHMEQAIAKRLRIDQEHVEFQHVRAQGLIK